MSRLADAEESGSPEAEAADAGLVYVSDDQPGIGRRRAGRGFSYRLPDGTTLRDEDTLARIRALAIPPAYTEVWICLDPRGHLQATGRDARRRKQYRYHPRWAQVRGEGKFERLTGFARALPRLRRRLRADLKRPGLPREKVLAVVVSLLLDTLARVGNDSYARENRSYGLTTLRDRHADFLRGGRARLKFRGKGGQEYDLEIDDPRLAKLVRACQELPGQALFQYRDEDGGVQPVDSGDVNDYLRDATGADFTAKDIRTWGGTLHAFRRLAATPLPEPVRGDAPGARALAEVRNQVIKAVAGILGNTPAVCRKAYIDPLVFAGWEGGTLARAAGEARGPRQWEQAAMRYLSKARRQAARPAGEAASAGRHRRRARSAGRPCRSH